MNNLVPSEHDSAGTGSESLGDITRGTNTSVRDDGNAVLACFVGTLDDSGQLRHTAASDNARDAATDVSIIINVSVPNHYLHRAWSNTNLDAVSAGQNQIARAFSSAHVTGDHVGLGESLLQLFRGLKYSASVWLE